MPFLASWTFAAWAGPADWALELVAWPLGLGLLGGDVCALVPGAVGGGHIGVTTGPCACGARKLIGRSVGGGGLSGGLGTSGGGSGGGGICGGGFAAP